jgi:hypothetical protein
MTNFAAADILIYKDGGTTERASTAGFTATTDFDAKTGKHLAIIDLADNTTANFYTAGSEYLVAIDSVTVDAVTVGAWVARFRIGYPNAILDTTIATLSTQTSFTLTTGPAEDDALNGHWVIIHDIASAVQMGKALVLDYTGSTRTVTLAAGTTFTAAAGDNISIMGLAPLQPTVTGRTLDVTATGAGGIDWGNVENPTTSVNLSATTTNLVNTATTATTATNLTNLPSIPANWLTAAGIAAAALNGKGDWNIGKTGYALTATTGLGNQTANITGNLSGSVGSVTGLTAANLDVAVSSRMATYTQPTGFLAATFPTGTIANTTNITAGTITTATNVTTVNGLAANVITAAAINTGAITAAKFAASAIDAAAIASNAITSAKIATGAITSTTFAAGAIDAAAIANNAIDRATFAADTGLQTVRSNTAQAGASTSITLDASASSVTNFYNNDLVYITGGTGAGQSRFITAYDGTTKVATVTAWATNPDNTSTFAIMQFDAIPGASAPSAATVAAAVWSEAIPGSYGAGTAGNKLNSAGSAGDPWSTALPGAYSAGTAGNIIGNRIDAAITSRMASYTQPTGFLAATFPGGTIANTTNITAATGITVSTNSDKTGYSLTATTGLGNQTANITGTITTATNVTTVNGLAANVITAAATAADFGTEVGTAVWATAARTLTAATNITSTGGTITVTSGRVNADVTHTRGTASVGEPGYMGIDWGAIFNTIATVSLDGTSFLSCASVATVTTTTNLINAPSEWRLHCYDEDQHRYCGCC